MPKTVDETVTAYKTAYETATMARDAVDVQERKLDEAKAKFAIANQALSRIHGEMIVAITGVEEM